MTTLKGDGPSRSNTGLPFGRSITDLFTHSWRDEPISKWNWIPKLAVLGEVGFPAHREGWKARRLARVPPLLPFTKSFANTLQSKKMREDPRSVRREDLGGSSKHRFEDDRRNNPRLEEERRNGPWFDEDRCHDPQFEGDRREAWAEEREHKESQLRERLQGEREFPHGRP